MQLKLEKNNKYQSIKTIDAHTEGEPLRIITEGYPHIPGACMLEKRRFVKAHLDHLRQVLMYEPRGHADMYGALITDAVTQDGDFGILFMHNEGYSSMCGHGILAVVTVMAETGVLEVALGQTKRVNIDSPAGRIVASVVCHDGAFNASFICVPSFVECTNREVQVEGLGSVNYDIVFGGAYYAYVDADQLGLNCAPDNVAALIEYGRAIKHAVSEDYQIHHPTQSDLSFLYGTIFTSQRDLQPDSHSRHVCIFADGEVDRSPTGTGVSGRVALLHENNQIGIGQKIKIESLIASHMLVSATESMVYEGKPAVIPEVSGRAYITGQHIFLLDPNDPIEKGFLLR